MEITQKKYLRLLLYRVLPFFIAFLLFEQCAICQQLSDKEILSQCFGHYLDETKEAYFDWTKYKVPIDLAPFNNHILYAKVMGKKMFKVGENNKCMVAIGSIPREYNCGGCGTLISLVEFEFKEKGWTISGKNSFIGCLGYWGIPPKTIFYKISHERYAVGFEYGRMAQGITFTELSVFAKIRIGYKEIFGTTVYNDETGSTDAPKNAEKYNSTVSFISSTKDSTFFDLKLDKRTVAPKKKRVVEIYTFDGEKYSKE